MCYYFTMNEIKYTLVSASNEAGLVEAVNNMLTKGYVPVGGVACIGASTQYGHIMDKQFYQAMLFTDKEAILKSFGIETGKRQKKLKKIVDI